MKTEKISTLELLEVIGGIIILTFSLIGMMNTASHFLKKNYNSNNPDYYRGDIFEGNFTHTIIIYNEQGKKILSTEEELNGYSLDRPLSYNEASGEIKQIKNNKK